VPWEDLVELLSGAQSADDASLALLVVVFAEDLAGTRDEDLLLSELLCSVPPLSDHVWEDDTEQNRVDEQNVFAGTFCDKPLWQGNTDAKALLAIRVTILLVVVADLLVCECLVRFGDIDPVVVDRLDGDVLRRVFARFVGMQPDGQLLVVLLDRLLVRVLFSLLAKYPLNRHECRCTYP
jgi:hypothetical protein